MKMQSNLQASWYRSEGAEQTDKSYGVKTFSITRSLWTGIPTYSLVVQ